MKLKLVHVAAVLSISSIIPLHATGNFGPDRWLDNGGEVVIHAPEFYWADEVKQLSKAFTPTEKRVTPKAKTPDEDTSSAQARSDFTGEIDAAEYKEALAKGYVKATDPVVAQQQHEEARKAAINVALNKGELPNEPASEFADYTRGAYAFWQGPAKWDEARKAFEDLLKRPEGERHYRSTWAAYMLGKLAVYEHKADASQWFQLTRSQVKKGFADALGLAAESYGWEAKSELEQGHFEAAAKLYLTQLALGDLSAVVSLKSVIPDRPSIFGMMNFEPNGVAVPPESFEPADPVDPAAKPQNKPTPLPAPPAANTLGRCVADPVLRALVTAHVLSTETVSERWRYPFEEAPVEGAEKTVNRSEAWLAELEKAKLGEVANAEQVGWIAYNAGRYDEAARWLKRANAELPATLWLQAKLLRRDGKLNEATAAMQKTLAILQAGPAPLSESEAVENAAFLSSGEYSSVSFASNAAGDLAALHLQRNEFVEALDCFFKGKIDSEAAYVAERVLTLDELKGYVEALPAETKSAAEQNIYPIRLDLRWLYARRCVRDDRYDEAAKYMPAAYQPALKLYVGALQEAANEKSPKASRAQAWSTAAWICRGLGMELMGTEVEPDNFASEGAFETVDIASMRANDLSRTKYDDNGKLIMVKGAKPSLPATEEEKKRLAKNKPSPDVRYHYRHVAAALAWKAAALMPDQSNDLADALNSAGLWIKDRDEKGADKFFQAIERRAAKTPIGRAAGAKHWFVDETGPWSGAKSALLDKLNADIEVVKSASAKQ